MEVFRVSAYYKAPHGLSVVNMVAACPTGETCICLSQNVGSTINSTNVVNQVAFSLPRM